MQEAEQILRSRLNFQGTTMGFSTERSDFLWWLMISGDVNANRVLLAMLDRDSWREDMPRLARGSLGRQQRGHWNTTVANAWGVLAMEKFARSFEKEPVTGSTSRRSSASRTSRSDWSKTARRAAADVLLAAGTRHARPSRTRAAASPGRWCRASRRSRCRQPLSSGYRITRTRVRGGAEGRRASGSRGDVMRVRLELEAQSDMTWVVVNDPVPAGASVLGTGLGRDSQILAAGEKKQGLGLAGVRGAQVRFVSRLLPLRAQGQVDGRVHACG